MADSDEGKPRFNEFEIKPKIITRPRDGITPIDIEGEIYTGGDRGPVDITVISPSGKEDTQRISYAKTEKHWIINFQRKYGIQVDSELGTYKVKSVIPANPDEKREGTFEVK